MMDNFNCVVIDRDVTPDLCKRFAVNAYPSMVVLNAAGQKIHRWSGFSDSRFFIAQCTDARERFELFKAGKEWDTPGARPERIGTGTCIATRVAGSSGIVQGVAVADDRLWCHINGTITGTSLGVGVESESTPDSATKPVVLEVPKDPASGRVEGANDICFDDAYLYVCPFSWKSGNGIQRYDRKKQAWVEPLVTAAFKGQRGYGTAGITSAGEFLYTVQRSGGQLAKVRKDTGEVVGESVIRVPGFRLHNSNGLDFDGTCLLTAVRLQAIATGPDGKPISGVDRNTPMTFAILRVEPDTGRVVSKIDLNYWINAVAIDRRTGRLFLGEQPTQWIDKNHEQSMVPPVPTIHEYLPPTAATETKPRDGDGDGDE
ncbi:MAG: hypothetical protein AB7K09_03285 [Planctomycetota bacterium]